MDYFNLLAFNAFVKLHQIGKLPLSEAWYMFNHICVDDAYKDIYLAGYCYAKRYKLVAEVQECLTNGCSIREALREWDLL